jgi:putative spermidine/putrescine transport system ATP-binding protein
MVKHGAKLVLSQVHKEYQRLVALHPTNLEIEPGEFFSLIGPSGSGKTTLLGAVAGFVPPSGGGIEIDGTDVAALPPYKRNIGMVFQSYALFPHMSVFDNIAFPLRLRKLPSAQVEERTRRMLATVRLPNFGHRMPNQLSGGQQQRVALARAAVYGPPMLLMDEPLGALDKNLREEMQYEIKAFHRQVDATVLYVTHDQEEAAVMSDRLAIMSAGRIVQYGTPRHLYEHPSNAFVASFLGGANLFDLEGKPDGTGQYINVRIAPSILLKALNTISPGAASEPGVICVRPESISIETDLSIKTHAENNQLIGRIMDSTYTAGTFRYQVEANTGAPITVRMPSIRRTDMIPTGKEVSLIWPASATLLIRKD